MVFPGINLTPVIAWTFKRVVEEDFCKHKLRTFLLEISSDFVEVILILYLRCTSKVIRQMF